MQPYTKLLGVRDFLFWYCSDTAVKWYDPIKPYVKLEYEWVLDNVKLKGQNVMDVGSHYGHYSIILASQAEKLLCVEPDYPDIVVMNQNLKINNLTAEAYWGAVANKKGMRKYVLLGDGNGYLDANGQTEVETSRLIDLMPNANVIKMDIEGAEFEVLPEQVDEMSKCHTWIIEIHPHAGNPSVITKLFFERGYELKKVSREKNKVVDFVVGQSWQTPDTLIVRKV